MEASYSKNDMKYGRLAGVALCIAAGFGGLCGTVRYANAYSGGNEYDLRSETRVVNQDSGLESLSKCQGRN